MVMYMQLIEQVFLGLYLFVSRASIYKQVFLAGLDQKW